jgi:hypothetical protein
MELLKVNNKDLAKEFIDLPKKLYKNDPNWICPLDSDIAAVLIRPSIFSLHTAPVPALF